MASIGFDNDKYIKMQSEHIRERIAQFGGKLYLEFGGKLTDDYHASRVLPGFQPDSKFRMLQALKDDTEIVIAINASDIESRKRRNDIGVGYDEEVFRLIGIFREHGFVCESVVITQYAGQASADAFRRKLADAGIRSYLHYPIPGYPNDVARIVSEEGYGKNEFVETSKPLVVITAPGPGSGKMATCLSQLYHEYQHGVKAGYAKFETFPIWNLTLQHPVNIAYEAATVDLDDVNMIDPYHMEAYGVITVNYNRDVEIFPVLRAMLERIQGKSPYQSPTDMGVNMAGFCISDDEACCAAARLEILRRYYAAATFERLNGGNGRMTRKMELLMQRAQVTPYLCPAVAASLEKSQIEGSPAGAIQLADGRIITGKTSNLMGPAAAALLNAVKALAGIDAEKNIISPAALEPICQLKINYLGHHNPRLHSDEVLIALSISSSESEEAALALKQLDRLRGCDAHFTVMLSETDSRIYKKLGMLVHSEPNFKPKL
ncbi:MAG: DUF1846 domain-containing protein [Clostridia bacterium]|nr:DUF1846 domain-containing protein [Clostridia bacterium]